MRSRMMKFDGIDFLISSAVACALLGMLQFIPEPIEISEIEIYEAGARSFRLGLAIDENPFEGLNEDRSRIWRMGFRNESGIRMKIH